MFTDTLEPVVRDVPEDFAVHGAVPEPDGGKSILSSPDLIDPFKQRRHINRFDLGYNLMLTR